jgi:quinolinate synthase
MLSYLHTITRTETYRILQTILATALGYLNKPQKQTPTLLFLPVYTSWQKQPRYYHQQKRYYCPTQRPDAHLVITYVNCTAELKALSDIVCTSSNAIQIVESLPADQKIIFGPDKNLGAYVAKKTGRDLVLWNGACMVHEIFSREKITKLKERYPNAKILAHPECEDAILATADYIGSTTGILKYATNSDAKEFIVATEPGIMHQMQKDNPDKVFMPAPPNNNCACNDCPHMKRNTLEKLYLCLKNERPEIDVPADIIAKAVVPIERMLEISARLGL